MEVEIYGVITSVTKNQIRIFCSDTKYVVYANTEEYNLPYHKFDLIACTINTNKLQNPCSGKMTKYPAVSIPDTSDSIRTTFSHIFGRSYLLFFKKIEHCSDISDELTSACLIWNKTRDESSKSFLLSCNFDSVQSEVLLVGWYKQHFIRQLRLLSLSSDKVKTSFIPEDEILQVALTNPFAISSITMDEAKDICENLDISSTDMQYYCGSLIRSLRSSLNSGDTYVVLDKMREKYKLIDSLIDFLIEKFYCVIENNRIYFRYVHQVSSSVGDLIIRLRDSLPLNLYVQSDQHDELTDEQKEALENATHCGLSLILGKAGTGKSTILQHLATQIEIETAFVSFTGKAVARLKQCIKKRPCIISTMDRMIASSMKPPITRLVIDEASMVTTELLFRFIQKFNKLTQLVLVGDDGQLPPISWGRLFNIVSSLKNVVSVTLTKNFRTTGTSIRELADLIRYQKIESVFPSDDIYIIKGDMDKISDIIQHMYENEIKSSDLILITPYNKYLHQLNQMFRLIYDEGQKRVKDYRGVEFSVSDRVLMTENNYEIDVMNGEEGYVQWISKDETKIGVKFQDQIFPFSTYEPEYRKKKIVKDEFSINLTTRVLVHGNAITVHRCVSKDTWISTENGLIQIGSLDNSSKKRLMNLKLEIDGKSESTTTLSLFRGITETGIKITTTLGYSMIGSKRHPILIGDEWISMRNLKVGDSVGLKSGSRFSSIEHYLRDFFTIEFGSNNEFKQIEYLRHGIITERKKNSLTIVKKYSGVFYDEIVSIEHLPDIQMYDFETNDSTFLSNGFISHNSQGSEWSNVIVVLPPESSPSFVTSRLVYTACTRCKDRLILWDPNNAVVSSKKSREPVIKDLLQEICE